MGPGETQQTVSWPESLGGAEVGTEQWKVWTEIPEDADVCPGYARSLQLMPKSASEKCRNSAEQFSDVPLALADRARL